MDAPVRAAEGGVRFDPERMEAEKIYHCVFGGKLLLVFKDAQEFVHCYEVEEPELVKRAEAAPPGRIEEILQEYVNTLNKKPPGAPDVRELAEQSRDAEDILSEFASKKAGSEAGAQEGREPEGGPAEAPPDAGGAGGGPDGEPRPGGAAEAGNSGANGPAEAGGVGAQPGGAAEAGKSGADEPAEAGGVGAQPGGAAEAGKSGADEPAEAGGVGAEPKDVKPEAPERNVIFVGTKPIMTYINATLQQMASYKVVTIKARGKRITQAVDVSQMIVKRMNAVGYVVADVRISSDSLKSQDGRERNVSTIELDIARS